MKRVRMVLKASYFVSDHRNPNCNIIMELCAEDLNAEDVTLITKEFVKEVIDPKPVMSKINEITRFLRLTKDES